MQRDSDQPNDRRRFLKTTVAATVATGTAALIPDAAVAGAVEPSKPEQKPEGYRVTPHVLDYYRSAKL
jgi:hypothetical protein